jgi:hypothetical protein
MALSTQKLVPKDPAASPRTLQFMNMVAAILNSLLNNGQLVQVGQSEWSIVTGETTILGVQSFETHIPSPLAADQQTQNLFNQVFAHRYFPLAPDQANEYLTRQSFGG